MVILQVIFESSILSDSTDLIYQEHKFLLNLILEKCSFLFKIKNNKQKHEKYIKYNFNYCINNTKLQKLII